ncbi:MAG TPA: DUF3999 domain-containing protein [Geobacteraceae bacterium]|nr:DUF3999 domain-containing protein [Geobacteraceae bacterium]
MISKILAILLVFAVAGPAFANQPRPDDFAYGMFLKTDGGEALYETMLSLPVYRSVTRGDLGDLCVFNGQREVVPFAIIRPPLETARQAESVPLPIFPLFAPVGQRAENLSLQVTKDKTGSIINVTTGTGAGQGREISAYLVDAGHAGPAVSALELELRALGDGFVRRVTVESGTDLEHWTTISPETTIVSLRYGAHTLERRTIELGSVRASYYRISSPDPGGMPELAGIRARLAAEAREPERQWITSAPGKAVKGGISDYTFDTAGHMPVDRIRVELPQDNTLVNAIFYSRPSKGEPWTARQSTLVYRLRLQGHYIANADITFPPCTDRYWLMRIDQTGGGLGVGTPKLVFGWVPEKLVFVARGAGPFILACGSLRARVDGNGGNELLAEFKNLRKENIVAKSATIGPRTILGGETALRPGIIPRDWKTCILWGALVLGVALLAWMAIRLHRQLK